MDEHTASRIAEGIKPRFADAQVAFTGGGFVNVFWTDNRGSELRSYLLGDEDGRWGFDEYSGSYMVDDEAEFLSSHEIWGTTPDTVIAELLEIEV
jgi:hypothetical protein